MPYSRRRYVQESYIPLAIGLRGGALHGAVAGAGALVVVAAGIGCAALISGSAQGAPASPGVYLRFTLVGYRFKKTKDVTEVVLLNRSWSRFIFHLVRNRNRRKELC